MTLQNIEVVDLGEIKVSNIKTAVFTISNIGSSLAVILYDPQNKVGGIAHVVLPESSLSNTYVEQLPCKYADKAVPTLMKEFLEKGGQKRGAIVKIVGGAQLFNFGGGAGNLLNIGARNATAVRAAMSKEGLAIEKADTGGNKTKSLRFVLATGQVVVSQLGGREYML
jgi:chemotaxis protein CheD